MKEAYKRADGKKVEGKRVVVDVERGRTVPNWYVLQRRYHCVLTMGAVPLPGACLPACSLLRQHCCTSLAVSSS